MKKAQMKTRLKSAIVALLLCFPLMAFLLSHHGETAQTACPYSIRISTPSDKVKIGEQIPINIVLTNTSTERCTYTELQAPEWPAIHYRIDVIRDNGAEVPKTQQRENMEYGLINLHGTATATWDPKEIKSENFILNYLYDISTPGTYLVRL